MKLAKNELLQVKGGAAKAGVIAGIVSGIVFIIGIIDGFMRPLKCN